MGVAALVLGIISVVCDLFSVIGGYWIGLPCAIVGIILAALAKKQPQKQGIATAGLVLSIIGAILNGITLIACLACGSCLSCGADSLLSSM